MAKRKYLLATVVALGLSAASVLGVSANTPAAPEPAQEAKPAPAQEAKPSPGTDPSAEAVNATPASIEMEWQRLQETWEKLPKAKKDQLYKAREAVDKADCAFIDKAASLKLIDEKIAERMKEHIKTRTSRIKESGEIPVFRRGAGQRPPQPQAQ